MFSGEPPASADAPRWRRSMKTGNDRILMKVRSICLALPETKEVEAWGHPTFRAGKKMFAACGEDAGVFTIGLKVGFDRQEDLLKDDRFYPTPYAAHQGWVSLRLTGKVHWNELNGLGREAFRPG